MNARFETLSRGNLYRRAYMGFNYRLRTFAGGRLAANCRPTDIGFMMTNLCNAKCVHCDIWKNKGRDDTPTPEQYKTVLSELRSWLGAVHVFFSGGEALLLKRIRAEKGLRFAIRLKTVIMEQNIHEVRNVAEYAATNRDGGVLPGGRAEL